MIHFETWKRLPCDNAANYHNYALCTAFLKVRSQGYRVYKGVFLVQCRDCNMALLMILGAFTGFIRRCAGRRIVFFPDVANRSSKEVITHHAEDPPALDSNRALWLRPQTQC